MAPDVTMESDVIIINKDFINLVLTLHKVTTVLQHLKICVIMAEESHRDYITNADGQRLKVIDMEELSI